LKPVYIASPIQTYWTTRYDDMVRVVGERFGDELQARYLFTSNSQWLDEWPHTLQNISAVIFFDDETGWIGKGVLKEINDAVQLKIPVYYIDDQFTFHAVDEFKIEEHVDNPWRRYAEVKIING